MKKFGILTKYFFTHKIQIIFLILLITHIFLRFYEIPQRTELGWDQIDSAWASYDILINNHVRLEGIPIKGNAGMYLGPIYYYLIAPFYLLTSLDPIASPIFAGVISIAGFFTLFYITKKIFGVNIALIALFINTFSNSMFSDRVQSAFTLIPLVSYVIFYFLYKIINGDLKYIIYLAVVAGFAFHIHFTSIFYPVMILLASPFFPRNKKTIYYMLLAVPIFILFVSPILYAVFFIKNPTSNNFVSYLNTYFHGLHLRRILQISHDAFISFEDILLFKILRPFVFLIMPLFILINYFTNSKKERFLLVYLLLLWILVPWFGLSLYRGELTDYYFSLPKYIAVSTIAFLTMYLYSRKFLLIKLFVVIFWIVYAAYNLNVFTKVPNGNYLSVKSSAEEAIRSHKFIEFKDREPYSYMYHIYLMRLEK